MLKGTLARTSVHVGRDQLEDLRQISSASGIPLAVLVRNGIGLYLEGLANGQIRLWDPSRVGQRADSAGVAASSPAASAPRTTSI